ncbi:3',5'-cyclic-nucleotide phosphodiesterase [Alteromonas pelagimontana]|uniref:3',5'-cyclic-nucleotide phosphodiesterase n=1 Tax=Alteromonas pelagimontana TaxID=1858656 RepID=A0A6M4MC43_9ALTE|nr:metallophosphoesterase [Alteromonas pelagimontana]QJR80378.1 3',5'-cyclic-nucleotide phosphodiesterase [Alteromonas pelagimontana]
MRLIQLTDCHLQADKSQCPFNGINPYETLLQCMDMALAETPDAILFTGDISGDESAESYQHFVEIVASRLHHIPWHVIAGNHDQSEHFTRYLGKHLLVAGKPWELGAWRVHGLDTRWQGTKGRVLPAALMAIHHAMARESSAYHMLALHHHILPSNSWMDTHYLANAERVLSWLRAHKDIQIVIHGHVHADIKRTHEGLSILGAPSTCWQWQMTETFGTDNVPAGYRTIDLAEDGNWSTTIRRLT